MSDGGTLVLALPLDVEVEDLAASNRPLGGDDAAASSCATTGVDDLTSVGSSPRSADTSPTTSPRAAAAWTAKVPPVDGLQKRLFVMLHTLRETYPDDFDHKSQHFVELIASLMPPDELHHAAEQQRIHAKLERANDEYDEFAELRRRFITALAEGDFGFTLYYPSGYAPSDALYELISSLRGARGERYSIERRLHRAAHCTHALDCNCSCPQKRVALTVSWSWPVYPTITSPR